MVCVHILFLLSKIKKEDDDLESGTYLSPCRTLLPIIFAHPCLLIIQHVNFANKKNKKKV